MERIRKFERKCLRACTSLYRSPDSNYVKYVCNRKLYNSSDMIRIDNFTIKLIRNHIVKSTQCFSNNLIMAPYYTNDNYIQKTLSTGFIPPEAFLYLDKKGYIQDNNGVPIFYHLYRRANVKAVNSDIMIDNDSRYDTSVSNRDRNERGRINTQKFWWIAE